MKKIIFAVMAAGLLLGASSCTTIKKTATVMDVNSVVLSGTEADLDVSPKKITFFYKVPKNVRRGGNKSAQATAVAEALKANGNADVLVSPQYEMKIKRGSVREITVTGYPATYKDFRNMEKPGDCPVINHKRK